MDIKVIGKTDSGKYKVKIDDEVLTTYDDVLIKNGLLYKKKIDNEMYEKMKKDHYYYDAYNKTISYIMKHQRASFEILKYLKKFELTIEDQDNILNHLKEIGLVNDEAYVRAYIADSIALTKDGPQKIKKHLLDSNIDESIIDDELSKIEEDIIIDKILKIISKKIKSNHKYSEYQFKQKVSLDLVNLGYDKDLVDSLLDNFDLEDDDLLEKEYDKIYVKLSKKYQGYELQSKIKQKLYAKGFDVNKITNLIQKKSDF